MSDWLALAIAGASSGGGALTLGVSCAAGMVPVGGAPISEGGALTLGGDPSREASPCASGRRCPISAPGAPWDTTMLVASLSAGPRSRDVALLLADPKNPLGLDMARARLWRCSSVFCSCDLERVFDRDRADDSDAGCSRKLKWGAGPVSVSLSWPGRITSAVPGGAPACIRLALSSEGAAVCVWTGVWALLACPVLWPRTRLTWSGTFWAALWGLAAPKPALCALPASLGSEVAAG